MVMPKSRLGRPAALAALLLALQLTQPQYALAKFRGAIQKPIPKVGNDGGMVYSVSGIIADLDNMSGEALQHRFESHRCILDASMCTRDLCYQLQCSIFRKVGSATSAGQALCAEATSELALTDAGGKRRSVKRTKGGLLPWWVRKRLQESSEPGPDASSEQGSTPKRLHTSVEVGASPLLSFSQLASCILILE